MKKLLLLTLVMLILVSITSFATAEKTIELDFWHSWGSGANYEALTKLVNDFNTAQQGKIHVTETYSGGYGDVLSKFNVAYPAGENPAVSIIDASMTLNAVEYGIMEDLTAYIEKNDPDYDIGQFIPNMLAFSLTEDGHVWSLPYARSTQVQYCNMDLIRDVMGKDATPPTCWDDIYAICKAYKEKYDAPAFSHDFHTGFWCQYITSMADGEFNNKSGRGCCVYVNDGWRISLTGMKMLIDNGWYSLPSLTSAGFWEDFKAGKLPICWASSGSLTGALRDCNELFDLSISFLPGYKHEDGTIEYRVWSGGANIFMASNKSDEEKAAAWEFIKFMTSAESNIYHSLATGYVISHIGAENNPEVQAKWASTPEMRVPYEQLQFVKESFVSVYNLVSDMDMQTAIEALAMDGLSVEDTLNELINVVIEYFPDGIVDSFES